MNLIKDLYAEEVRDASLEFIPPVFPLDIRRVDKVLTGAAAPEIPPLEEPGEEAVLGRELPLSAPETNISEDSPWKISDEQRALRDYPVRSWPPGTDINGHYLQTDNRIWREELNKDQLRKSAYFVTNLLGGTLIINGQQVRKGCIAGPLPAFAVIETHGGQVSFWHGVEGRYYKAGPEGVDLANKWALLRKEKEWENVAESAGEVWERKIWERVRAERTGNRNNDDEIWTKWKNTKAAVDEPEDHGESDLSWHAMVTDWIRCKEVPYKCGPAVRRVGR